MVEEEKIERTRRGRERRRQLLDDLKETRRYCSGYGAAGAIKMFSQQGTARAVLFVPRKMIYKSAESVTLSGSSRVPFRQIVCDKTV